MRMILGVFLCLIAGILGFVGGAGLTQSMFGATVIGIVFLAFAGFAISKFPIIQLESSDSSRGLHILSAIACVIAIFQLARLAVFMIDPSQNAYSTAPWSNREIRHSCLSAYYVADQAVRQAPDIYNDSIYSLPNNDPTSMRKPKMIGPFLIDVYEYPPPFLLIPRAFSLLTPDFFRIRMLWFALNGFVVLIAMLIVANFLDRDFQTRALLLLPLVWAALPFVNTLQKGNVQLVIIALSMIAMVLFAKRRSAGASALLAYATASKIYPGMLIVYLLIRRQWRAIIFTIVSGVCLTVLTILMIGWKPFEAFLQHLPAILGGEAFPAFRNPSAIAVNYSVPGIIFKLKLFGIPGMDFSSAKIVGWIYTLVLLAVIFIVAKSQSKREEPLVWLGILILATLRSPFLPQAYASFPPLWLLTLLAAFYDSSTKNLLLIVLVWLCLNISVPIDWGIDPRLIALITLIPQLLTIALAVVALRKEKSASPQPA